MNWIYGSVQPNASNKTSSNSYKINPADIVAVDLNNKSFISKTLGILYYLEEDEPQILKLIESSDN